jgi:PEP-CTERM motif
MREIRLALAACVLSGAVSAGVVDTPSVAFSVNGTFSSTFQQFNSSLGTLTGVAVVYNTVDFSGDLALLSVNAATGSTASYDFWTGLELKNLPGVAAINPFLQSPTVHMSCTSSGGSEFSTCSSDHLFNFGSIAGSQGLSPSPNLSAYIGSGTVPFQLVSLDSITNKTLVDDTGSGIETRLATGNIYLEYTYTAATSGTPEPSTFGLMGAGLAAAALIRRRVRNF